MNPLQNPPAKATNAAVLLWTVYFIYFFCGLTQCFEGAFLPEFKEHFRLGYQQQMYLMFAKNIPFVLAIAIGFAVRRIGYKKCLTLAMLLYACGTFLLVPGLQATSYGVVLFGMFLIGLGFNFQMVAGNPLLTTLGPEAGSSSRLNLGNALGAFAQIMAPAILSFLIPAAAVSVSAKLPVMSKLFVVLGAVLLVTAAATAVAQRVETPLDQARSGPIRRAGAHLMKRDLLFGFATILLVLGAEAALFGFFRNYLEDPTIAGLSPRQSQRMFTVYLAVFALGRTAASWIQKRIRPAVHVIVHAGAAFICVLAMMATRGAPAIAALLAAGFFVSIFYPTLYALAIEGMGEWTGEASGLLTVGFLGCAVIPVLQGRLADAVGIQRAYGLDLVAYVCAAAYGVARLRKRVSEPIPAVESCETHHR
jgi:FHS family L-fucose permease-like MFS transporter